MDNTYQNIPTILKDHRDWRSQFMEQLILESYLLTKSTIGW